MSFGTKQIQAQNEMQVSGLVNVEANSGQLTQEERRASLRRRVLKGGNIFFNKGYGAYDCTLKNLSETGALIKMDDSSGLPGTFEFAVKGDDIKRQATIAWRNKGMAGVKFL